MGVERFAPCRGTPAMIWSDNGTNCIRAAKELRECIDKLKTLSIAAKQAHKAIKWRFNPSTAPLQGYIWERLIRIFKRELYRILGMRCLTDETFKCHSFLVEYALKVRHITLLSADTSDLGAIKPNYCLLGIQANGIPSIAGVDEFYHRKRNGSHKPMQFGRVG